MDAREWPALQVIEDLCAWAARVHWTQLLSYDSRWEAAWDGITEAITAGEENLAQAALFGINRARDQVARHHGLPVDRTGQTGARHAAYWRGTGRTLSPFEAADDTIAVRQIWPLLRDRDRLVLTALAAADMNQGDAADIAGLTWRAFTDSLLAARQRARRIWFYPETPPRRVWGRADHRHEPGAWRNAAWCARTRRKKERTP
jgi:hypothetical protein